MGRGRAKAKQTKVARELKYNTPRTDFEALRAELSGRPANAGGHESDTEDDPYSKYVEDDDEPDGGR